LKSFGVQVALSLEDVNPVGLGRRSRQLFDNVWRRLTDLGQLTSSTRVTDDYEYENVVIGGPMCDFTTPNAELTTVLVAGATGRVGRILVRKLQLRGYKVKVCQSRSKPYSSFCRCSFFGTPSNSDMKNSVSNRP